MRSPGTINGQPIKSIVMKDYPQNRCTQLYMQVMLVARDEQMKRLAITVRPAEIEEERKKINYDPEREYRQRRDHGTLLLSALEAVDKGEDPQAVYDRLLKPKDITQQEWTIQQEPRWRKLLTQEATRPLAWYQRLVQRIPEESKRVAMQAKLDATVDQQLAMNDPKFAEYLAEASQQRKAALEGIRLTEIERQEAKTCIEYLLQKRQDYWKQMGSKIDVVINEPSLRNCDLSGIGVTIR